MLCRECFYENAEEARYCIICGKDLDEARREQAVREKRKKTKASRPKVERDFAKFMPRTMSQVIDTAILSPIFLLVILFAPTNAISFENLSKPFLQAFCVYILLQMMYYSVFESSTKQASVGKILMQIRVEDENGKRLTFAHALGRCFFKILISATVTSGVGFLVALFSGKGQGLHDIMASTYVVKSPK